MAPLTWKNVSAPDSANSIRLMQLGAENINNSMNDFGSVLEKYAASETAKDDRSRLEVRNKESSKLRQALAGITDPEQMRAIMQSPGGAAAWANVNPDFLNSSALTTMENAYGDRISTAGDLLDNANQRIQNISDQNQIGYDAAQEKRDEDQALWDAETQNQTNIKFKQSQADRKETERQKLLQTEAEQFASAAAQRFENAEDLMSAIRRGTYSKDPEVIQAQLKAAAALADDEGRWVLEPNTIAEVEKTDHFTKATNQISIIGGYIDGIVNGSDAMQLFHQMKSGEFEKNVTADQALEQLRGFLPTTGDDSEEVDETAGSLLTLYNRLKDTPGFRDTDMPEGAIIGFIKDNIGADWLLKRGNQKIEAAAGIENKFQEIVNNWKDQKIAYAEVEKLTKAQDDANKTLESWSKNKGFHIENGAANFEKNFKRNERELKEIIFGALNPYEVARQAELEAYNEAQKTKDAADAQAIAIAEETAELKRQARIAAQNDRVNRPAANGFNYIQGTFGGAENRFKPPETGSSQPPPEEEPTIEEEVFQLLEDTRPPSTTPTQENSTTNIPNPGPDKSVTAGQTTPKTPAVNEAVENVRQNYGNFYQRFKLQPAVNPWDNLAMAGAETLPAQNLAGNLARLNSATAAQRELIGNQLQNFVDTNKISVADQKRLNDLINRLAEAGNSKDKQDYYEFSLKSLMSKIKVKNLSK